MNILLVREKLSLNLVINNLHANLFQSLPSIENTLNFLSHYEIMLISLFFLQELFIHDLVNPFVHDLIKFSLFEVVEILHYLEVLSEVPEIESKIEPPSQSEVTKVLILTLSTFLLGKIYNFLPYWVNSLCKLRGWMINNETFIN